MAVAAAATAVLPPRAAAVAMKTPAAKSVCTKKGPYPIHYSLLIYPKLILLWSVPDGRTEKIVHPLFPNSFFFTERAGPYPQAQIYWAG